MQSNRGFRSPRVSFPLAVPVLCLLGLVIASQSAETGALAADEPPEFGWMDIVNSVR